jgi:hypothetical protein
MAEPQVVNPIPADAESHVCVGLQGLDGLTNLRELYLYSNKLRSIRNLEHLTNLEVRLCLTEEDMPCIVLRCQ